jgi:hypothetical protein
MHARLDQANLSAANLSNARLDYADLAGANLTKVNLCGASLRFATLLTADLQAADISGADLMHARLDQANLSAANFSNARLDYADFGGASLTKVNLCGASLKHAKNLTQAQIEDSIGSASTILPPHLQGSVSWSAARSQTEQERRDLRPRARHTADVDVPHISPFNVQVWRVGALFIGVALVTIAFVWQHMNDAVRLDNSGAQRGSEPFLTEPKLSPDTGDRGLPPTAPEALMEEKATAERRLTADPEIPPMPSGASTVDQTESTPQQHPAPETDRATVPQETNAQGEPQASDGAKRSAEAFGPNEQAPSALEEGREPKSNEASEASALVSAESPRHGIVPDFVSAESPAATSRHGTAPDLPAEVSMPNPQLARAIEAPAEALPVNTPEPSAASSLSETLRPPVVAPLPSSVIQGDVQTALPPSAETTPTPVRNPARLHGAKGQNSVDQKTKAPAVVQKDVQTVLPPSAETPPTPVRNPCAAAWGQRAGFCRQEN